MVENKRAFSLSPSEPLRVEQEIKDNIDPAKLNHISISDLENQNVHYLIKCGICAGLAHIPLQDENCDQLFCTYCITNALKDSQKCPVSKCSGDFSAAKRITRYS